MNKELKADTNLSLVPHRRQNRRGRDGELFLAADTKLNRQVALKILSEEFAENA